ncbi:MAG: hypothetical protein ACREE0_17270 [Phenylobacterium sp.]
MAQLMEDAMPIMAIYRSGAVDQETFDRIRIEVPIEPIPDGAISHHVAFGDDGLIGIDVWESEAHLAAFTRDRLNPGLSRLGLALEPPQVLELREFVAVSDAARHNVEPTAQPS